MPSRQVTENCGTDIMPDNCSDKFEHLKLCDFVGNAEIWTRGRRAV